jgi:hypothetical protein
VAPIDDDDRLALSFLAEHRVTLDAQVQVLLRASASATERRLRALARARLLHHEKVFTGLPAAVWITRRGLDAVESALPAPRLDLKGYRHDVGVAWLWLAAREGVFGPLHAMRSERAMRSHDRRPDREDPQLGVRIAAPGPRGGERLHYPDLLLEPAGGGRIALELELSAKGPRRLERVMRAYAFDTRVASVLYLVPDRRRMVGVERAARRAGLADLVHVQLLAPRAPAGAPDPGRLATRVRAPAAAQSHGAPER